MRRPLCGVPIFDGMSARERPIVGTLRIRSPISRVSRPYANRHNPFRITPTPHKQKFLYSWDTPLSFLIIYSLKRECPSNHIQERLIKIGHSSKKPSSVCVQTMPPVKRKHVPDAATATTTTAVVAAGGGSSVSHLRCADDASDCCVVGHRRDSDGFHNDGSRHHRCYGSAQKRRRGRKSK